MINRIKSIPAVIIHNERESKLLRTPIEVGFPIFVSIISVSAASCFYIIFVNREYCSLAIVDNHQSHNSGYGCSFLYNKQYLSV